MHGCWVIGNLKTLRSSLYRWIFRVARITPNSVRIEGAAAVFDAASSGDCRSMTDVRCMDLSFRPPIKFNSIRRATLTPRNHGDTHTHTCRRAKPCGCFCRPGCNKHQDVKKRRPSRRSPHSKKMAIDSRGGPTSPEPPCGAHRKRAIEPRGGRTSLETRPLIAGPGRSAHSHGSSSSKTGRTLRSP